MKSFLLTDMRQFRSLNEIIIMTGSNGHLRRGFLLAICLNYEMIASQIIYEIYVLLNWFNRECPFKDNFIKLVKLIAYMKENEIIFLVEESKEGGFEARALEYSIFTEADDIEGLKKNIKEAVHCHFEDNESPSIIRLHYIKEELIPAWKSRGILIVRKLSSY